MIMGSAALPLLIFLPFFHIRAFSIQWTRLPQSLEQASQLILREHLSFFRMAKLKKSHNFFPLPIVTARFLCFDHIYCIDIFIKILNGSLCGGESVLRGSSQTSAESTGKKRRPIIAHSLIWEMHFGPSENSRETRKVKTF